MIFACLPAFTLFGGSLNMAGNAGFVRRLTQTLGSIKTGITLLIIVGIVAALGTVISQRPMTSAAEMEQKFSPAMLRFLDTVGLTDVYHSWWFIVLLGLVAITIIFASIERWPNAWRYYDRPYRKPDVHFRGAHPTKAQFAIHDAETGLSVAERAMRKFGLSPERINQNNEVSLFAEKNRFAVLAVYIVHASLLMILLGYMGDKTLGFQQARMVLTPGTTANDISLADRTVKTLPFSIRCDGAGQEVYSGQFQGMPKRYWSKLTVLENGREVLHKEIAVNEPLVYKGIRFYQADYGMSGELKKVQLAVVTGNDISNPRLLNLTREAESAKIQDGTQVKLARFIPDAYAMDGQMFERSGDLSNPAAQVEITRGGKTESAWLLASDQAAMNEIVLVGPYTADGNPVPMPYRFVARLEMEPFTGLQVSHEPGQWSVWSGCLLMGLGLIVSFYVVHMRFWAVTFADGKGGLTLWVGAAANKKNRESFEQKWRDVTEEIGRELNSETAVAKAGK
jgi:cytochrome c biogenesis protein